jgi:extradiol dioxygenase family protein
MAHNTFHVAISVKDLPGAIAQYTKMLGDGAGEGQTGLCKV